MRLTKERVEYLANKVTEILINDGYIIYPGGDIQKLKVSVSEAITRELMIESQVENEVKEIMQEHYSKIDELNADYRKIYQMIKKKLVREKGIIL